ncbi:SphA family protein [Mucilaginibacter kameinonensis]|uniref:SphA family protein n=1 Tax=Mucilaginibacter kameinonensis TaxID=452286 RepID=UPI000EF7E7A7|nr:transporter [Mucilaginibacter kameinonensis]
MKNEINTNVNDENKKTDEPVKAITDAEARVTRPLEKKEKSYKVRCRRPLLLLAFCLSTIVKAYAQDPALPPTNLGLANIYDGVAGKPGFIYQGYAQYFQAHQLNDGFGNNTHSDLKVNSLLQMNQLIYLSPVRVMGGKLGFTVIVPFVQISSSRLNNQAQAPTVNPGVLGDVVQGTAVQWSDKKLFGKPFSHRVEFDINVPVGSYDSRYNINPSSHVWAYGIYHAFTLMLNDQISISSRNQFNYNSHFIGQKSKAGAYYNGNYSIDYSILKSLKIEAAAYYLTQFNQDSYDGGSHYYQGKYGIDDTKERVFGYGPGLAYFAPNGTLIEAKVFFETAAKNRFEGTRPTLRIAIPLSK